MRVLVNITLRGPRGVVPRGTRTAMQVVLVNGSMYYLMNWALLVCVMYHFSTAADGPR